MRSKLPIAACLSAAIAALLVLVEPAQAGPACSDFTPTDDSLGFRARSNSERCEGLYVEPASGGGIELFSLTYGGITFGSSKPPILVLWLDTPPDKLAATTLFGMGTCAGRNYLMKARGPTMPFYLPTGAVMRVPKLVSD
jgi:hypothetical protein